VHWRVIVLLLLCILKRNAVFLKNCSVSESYDWLHTLSWFFILTNCGLAFVNAIYSWFLPSMRISMLNKKKTTSSTFHVIPDAYNLKFFLHSDIFYHCRLQAQLVYCGFRSSAIWRVLFAEGVWTFLKNVEIHPGQEVQEKIIILGPLWPLKMMTLGSFEVSGNHFPRTQ
jgi:hypothetical protein